MSDRDKYKTIDNNIIFKNKNELINKLNKNSILLSKRKAKILNKGKILSKGNFSLSRNRNTNKKTIQIDDLFLQRLTKKSNNEIEPKSHKKNLTNIYDDYTNCFKSDINSDLINLTDKKLFENKMHRRIQTERENIDIIKKINKTGNRHVLLNLRNLKRNNEVNTEYLFTVKYDKANKNANSIYHSTYLNLSTNKSFQKKKNMKKIYPSLSINDDNIAKNNSNNNCLKSCNFENNQNFLKNKIYPSKKKSKIIENIFKTQYKIRNNHKFYSQDNSISNLKSNNLKKKLNYFQKFPKRRIYLTSKIEQSFELINNSNSNNNIKIYTKSFDDNIKKKILNIGGKEIQKDFFSPINKKASTIEVQKPNKKNSSNFDLKKIFHYTIKENEILNYNLENNKNDKLIKKKNSKSSEPKPLINKYSTNTTNSNQIKQLKKENNNNNKSRKKNKKLIRRNILTDLDKLQLKESIKIKNPTVNLHLKLNNDSQMKIKEFLNQKKIIKHPKNNLIKPKNIPFQSKKIIKIESLSKKGFWGMGMEKANQDNYFILNNINDNPNYIYMGVCDGHGKYGKEVSNFIINNLPQNLNQNIINNKIKYLTFESINNLSSIIINSFIQTNNELINNPKINTYLSGSTCVSILFTSRRLISINLGDSRCILGKFNGDKWQSKNLSRDHKPSEEDEKKRIISCGGRIDQNRDEFGNSRGPLRIWLKDEDTPGLAVSRSFGDELAHKIGVINEPEIEEYVFLSEDKFFILASDGLWEYISSEECVDFVKDYYLKNDIEGAINFLYRESSKRWIMKDDVIDDTTLIIVFMN